jgi:hypothetical protein
MYSALVESESVRTFGDASNPTRQVSFFPAGLLSVGFAFEVGSRRKVN